MRTNKTILFNLLSLSLLAVYLTSCSSNSKKAAKGQAPVQTINTNHNQSYNSSAPIGYHKIQSGENLYRISLRYNTTVPNLARLNNISDPSQIKVGQLIKVPGGASLNSAKHKSPARYSSATSPTSKTKFPISTTSTEGLAGIHFSWPTEGTVVTNFNGSTNKGIDIQTSPSAPVKAAQSGTIVYSDYVEGYGHLIMMNHNGNNSILTAYSNVESPTVKPNEQVKKGQVIANVGRNANNQTILHFEIRNNGKAINPMLYLGE